MNESRKDFVSEAEELVRDTEDGLLDLRENLGGVYNPDVLNGVFRAMHTLKGLSGLFGLKGISALSHAMETLLDELRLGRQELTDETLAVLLRNVDLLKRQIQEVADSGDEQSSVEDALVRLRAVGRTGDAVGAGSGPDPIAGVPEDIVRVLSEYEEHRLRAVLAEGRALLAAAADFQIETFEHDLKALTDRIGGIGELIATMPRATEVEPGNIAFELLLAPRPDAASPRAALEGCVLRELVPARRPDRGTRAVTGASSPARPDPSGEPPLRSTSSTVRVDIDKLDAILNTVGELVLAKGAVGRINTEFNERFGHTPLSMDLQKVYKTLEKHLADLQGQILEVRMVPVSQIFSRLHRVVRRYTRDRGKEIELQLFGESTEIDKMLAEEVVDPLMHLIRNAIDHGIEPVPARASAGKADTGIVTLRAYPRGNHVVFEVSDDGRGIDAAFLRAQARERGLIPEGEDMSDEDAIQLIFRPGFSTAGAVSDMSGRGVGMDVVKEKIASLGGFVEVRTAVGTGTTCTVVIPITLAIIKAVLVRIGREIMAIPLAAAAETLSLAMGEIQRIEGREVVELRGEMLPIVRLDRVFRLPRDDEPTHGFVVINGYGARRVGFLVDDIIAQQEVVIKGLGRYLEGLRGIAGAAEVGRHRVVLVLDAEALVEESLTQGGRTKAEVL